MGISIIIFCHNIICCNHPPKRKYHWTNWLGERVSHQGVGCAQDLPGPYSTPSTSGSSTEVHVDFVLTLQCLLEDRNIPYGFKSFPPERWLKYLNLKTIRFGSLEKLHHFLTIQFQRYHISHCARNSMWDFCSLHHSFPCLIQTTESCICLCI